MNVVNKLRFETPADYLMIIF